ncbi:MAG: hypothetical protein ACUVRZ_06920 [Desulfobacca sp.]|uniref:hypothetical protein n=1 Tax=Desulfobacca sp. TaxID=2067990 RepID=UPI0040494D61
MPPLSPSFTYMLLAIAAAVVWLLLREFNCWYWKINERLALLEEIVARLERLEQERQAQAEKTPFPEITID